MSRSNTKEIKQENKQINDAFSFFRIYEEVARTIPSLVLQMKYEQTSPLYDVRIRYCIRERAFQYHRKGKHGYVIDYQDAIHKFSLKNTDLDTFSLYFEQD